jgi:hypothetical protein
MTTTENNNKLIAEFMEAVTIGAGKHTLIAFPDTKIEGGGLISNNRSISDLHYHTSWYWLMPVVEKIEEITIEDNNMTIKSHRFLVEIVLGSCEIYDSVSSSVVGSGDYGNKLDSTYNAVVEFIKWYNNQ